MKSKTMKRAVISTALALTLTAGLSIPTAASFRIFCHMKPSCLWQCPDWQKPENPILPDVPPIPDVPEQEAPKPESPESGSTAASAEKQVADLVNAQRAQHGLSALTFSQKLSEGARAKSQDMAKNNYFSHTSPTYGSPFDMMKTFGITYRSAGENIAKGYSTPEAVVAAWMNSEDHRENILSSKYTAIGVGYIADGGYWTQWFTG